MADRAHVKLVTIIASYELKDRLIDQLYRLGARDYTLSRVDGHGKHGTHASGLFEIGNIRLETIVAISLAEAILDAVAREAERSELVAFAQSIEAVPSKHFV